MYQSELKADRHVKCHALSLAADLFALIGVVSGRQASRPVALLFPDQNSKSLKMLKGLQVRNLSLSQPCEQLLIGASTAISRVFI
jgi:hypothetical protein